MSIEYIEAKQNAAFSVLDKRCGHPWGVHAIVGCTHKGCDCKNNGINAIRSIMKDPNFKFTFVPPPKEKEEIQMKLQ